MTIALGGAAPARGATTPQLAVASASLIVAGSGQQLYATNGNAERAIASTTKIMTALVTLQHVSDLNQKFAQTDWSAAAADSQIRLSPGERMSVRDLLYALLIPSADDAAIDLAYNVGGHSVARFVAMMNQQARALGLTHTHYSTPSGLDTVGNYSSADDLVQLSRYVMARYPFFRAVVAMRSATLSTGDYVRRVYTTNGLLGEVSWIDGIKTGHTAAAGYVLVAQGTRHGLTLIDAVLGTASEYARDQNALALLNWGFANYRNVVAVHRGQLLAAPAVDGYSTHARVLAASSLSVVAGRGQRVSVVVALKSKPLTGPLAKGAIVGRATVQLSGKPVGSVALVLAAAVAGPPTMSSATKLLLTGVTLLVIGSVVGVVVTLRSRPRNARRQRSPSSRVRRFEQR